MSIRNMRRGIPNLFKQGTQHLSGVEQAVVRNLQACKQLAAVTRTSLGPNGMNKMLINHLEKMFVTTDTACIMREMEIDNPAAKLVSMASQMQEKEIGDGSNYLVILAGELLAKAEELIEMGLHPADILSGFKLAGQKAQEIMETLVVENIENKDMHNKETLRRGILAVIASKQFGYEQFLSGLISEACFTTMPPNPKSFNVDNVRVAKILGSNIESSEVVRGVVVVRNTEGNVKHVENGRVAVFTCNLAASQTETKATVLIKSAEELLNYNKSEENDMDAMIKSIKDSGVNVIISGGAIDEMAMHFCEKYKIMVLKISSKFELRRLCRTVKARPLVSLGPVRKDHQGFVSKVHVKEIGGRWVTVFEQDNRDDTQIATILLRGSTNNLLNDFERAVDDGVNIVKAMGRDGRFLAGAGACDIEMARQLAAYGSTFPGLEQYAIKKFGEAMEVIPRTLAENAGFKGIDIISKLYAAHEEKDGSRVGIEVTGKGSVKDMTTEGILDLLATKKQGLQLLLDVVMTLLRVDQIISAKPAGGPKRGGRKGHWDDDD